MDPAVVLPLVVAASAVLVLWTGLRRPRSAQQMVAAGTYRVQWTRFRNLNRLTIAIFLLNPISWFLVDLNKLDKSTFVALLALWIISWTVVGIYTYEFFRCPRCHNYFWAFGKWTHRNCAHCGLRLYEGG
jgi:hypothetical protein